MEIQGILILDVSCKKFFSIYWIVNSCFFSLFYLFVLFLWHKKIARKPVVPYVLTLLAINVTEFISAILLYFQQDFGLCMWVIVYFILYGFYVPTLYYTLTRDSVYWHRKRRIQDNNSSEKQPLILTFNIGIQDEWIIPWEDIIIGNPIGRGGYGQVYTGEYKGRKIAVKKLFYKTIGDKDNLEFQKECQILSSLDHPKIVKMIGVCIQIPDLAIITEYMPRGSLQDLLYDKNIKLDWKLRLKMVHDVAKGVDYLHSLKPCLIHRDLKSSNLLVGENYETKVSDFGIAKFKEERATTMVGTVQWMAPEVFRGKPYSSSVDTYSFGIILWEMVARQQPHENLLAFEIISGVAKENLRPPVPEDCAESYKILMRSCWDDNPLKRPTFDKIVNILSEMIVDEEMKDWA